MTDSGLSLPDAAPAGRSTGRSSPGGRQMSARSPPLTRRKLAAVGFAVERRPSMSTPEAIVRRWRGAIAADRAPAVMADQLPGTRLARHEVTGVEHGEKSISTSKPFTSGMWRCVPAFLTHNHCRSPGRWLLCAHFLPSPSSHASAMVFADRKGLCLFCPDLKLNFELFR